MFPRSSWENANSITGERTSHLTINLDSSTRVGRTEAKGLKKKRKRRMRVRGGGEGRRRTRTRSRVRAKNAWGLTVRAESRRRVLRSVELALACRAFGSLERIKASFSLTDRSSCVWHVAAVVTWTSQHRRESSFAISQTVQREATTTEAPASAASINRKLETLPCCVSEFSDPLCRQFAVCYFTYYPICATVLWIIRSVHNEFKMDTLLDENSIILLHESLTLSLFLLN